MSDTERIAALVHSYARLLDTGDVEGVVALFEDSTWRSYPNASVLHGSDEVRPIYENLRDRSGGHQSKHLITNLSIEVGPDATNASSHCYWTVLRTAPGRGIDITLSGQYTDTFEKVDDRWRFTDRLISTDLDGATSNPLT